jgi:hypothetical protein
MDTGFGTNQLYCACRLTITHHFADHDLECKPLNGTGFLVAFPSPDDRIALVTNRHLVDAVFYDDTDYKGATIKSLKLEWWQSKILRLEHTIIEPKLLYHEDPTIDVAIIPIAAEPGGAALDIFATLFADTAEWITEDSAEELTFNHALSWENLLECENLWPSLEPGEFVSFPGYPIWYDRLQSRPVLRSGVIASDPQTDYRLREGDPSPSDGNRQVLFDAFSTNGNSGSPIFVAQRGLPPLDLRLPLIEGQPPFQGKLTFSGYRRSFLIGINIGHYDDPKSPRPNDHAGLSRLHKLSAIIDVLRANAVPQEMDARRILFHLPVPTDPKERLKAETAARDKKITALRREGKSYKSIADEVGCSASTVSRVIRRLST